MCGALAQAQHSVRYDYVLRESHQFSLPHLIFSFNHRVLKYGLNPKRDRIQLRHDCHMEHMPFHFSFTCQLFCSVQYRSRYLCVRFASSIKYVIIDIVAACTNTNAIHTCPMRTRHFKHSVSRKSQLRSTSGIK